MENCTTPPGKHTCLSIFYDDIFSKHPRKEKERWIETDQIAKKIDEQSKNNEKAHIMRNWLNFAPHRQYDLVGEEEHVSQQSIDKG